MWEINSEMLTRFQNEYLNNKIFTVGRNTKIILKFYNYIKFDIF